MNSNARSRIPGLAIIAAILAFTGACSTTAPTGGRADQHAFAAVRAVIERNCVHCHGRQRLAGMPSFNDTHALAALRGSGNWIVPGQPGASRFLQVVTLSDSQAGAMPPTGHAISAAEIGKLRAWIAAGAPVPEGAPFPLTPRGEPPRSR